MPFVAAQTATDHDDLLDKLITFLTTTITPTNERWVVLKDVINPDTEIYTNQIGTTREVYLRGPGLSATETAITGVTDNGGLARFAFTGPTVELDQEVVIKDFVVNTDYNGVYSITATDGTSYFEVSSIDFGSDETGAFYTNADSINIQIRRHSISAVAGTAANWELQASTSFLDVNDFREQPGSPYSVDTDNTCFASLSNESFTYWFVGNGRYFWVATSISTVTTLFGGGFYLPYALTSEFPFPLFLAGNARPEGIRWNIGTAVNYNFFGQDTTDLDPHGPTPAMFVRHVDGFWLVTYCDTGPSLGDTTASLWPCDFLDARDIIDNQDNSYTLLPYIPFSGYSGGNVYGELDGVYWTTFFNIAALDTIQINSTDYLVLQNVWDTTSNIDFCALRLE